MRRLSSATLVFAVASMSLLGCRQTAGPTSGGSMSSGSMSPAMQSPSFNPFGGSTRVSPPPPNASAIQNPYIGGPPGQANAVQGTAGGFVSAAPAVGSPVASGQVVGSGVQPTRFVGSGTHSTAQAGFATTNDTLGPAGGGVAPASYGTTAPAHVNPFRAGGMQVNDLTRAPAPPGYQTPVGYQAPVPNHPATLMTAPGQPGTAPVQPTFAPVSAPISPANAPITPANGGAAMGIVPASTMAPIQQMPIQQTQYQQPQAWQGTTVASAPDTEIASRMVPVNMTPANSPAPIAPLVTSPAPTPNGGTSGNSELMWRRPGS